MHACKRVVMENNLRPTCNYNFRAFKMYIAGMTVWLLSLLQIFSQANSPLKRCLLNFAAKRKGAEVSSGIIRSDSIWDKIFFSKIQVNRVLIYKKIACFERTLQDGTVHFRLP